VNAPLYPLPALRGLSCGKKRINIDEEKGWKTYPRRPPPNVEQWKSLAIFYWSPVANRLQVLMTVDGDCVVLQV
jgi:hypothetical protein